MGKVEQVRLNPIGRRSSTRLFALLGKAHSKWWYETDLVEFDLKGVFSFRPDGERQSNSFEPNWTTFVNPAFCPSWKRPLKMVVWNRPHGIRFQGFFFVSPRWGKSNKFVWTQLDDIRQPGFLPCLEKPTQNGGMKPTSWNSIARVFFRFAPMGKIEKTRFEHNWTTFVNPAFCPAWKSPLKMVVWNRHRGIRSQRCFFVSPRWGKSKKRVLSTIGRRSSTRLFALLGKAHSKWWYETDLVEFDLKGVFSFRPDGERQSNSFEPNWTTFVNPAFCPSWKRPLKMVVWNRPHGIRFQGFFFVSPRWGKSNKFVWTQLDDIRQPGFLPCLEKPTQNGGMKPTSWNSIARVFFRFAPMGKIEKTRFEHNWTTFVNPAFCPAWKSPLKMVVWNRHRGIRSQRCFFVSPRWGKSKKRVLSTIGRRSSTRLFALLGKAHLKWWYETDPMEFDPKGFFSFRPNGESRTSSFWTQLDDVLKPGFLPCLEKPTQNGGMKPTPWNSIPRVFFSFRPDGESPRSSFEPNWTTFVNPGFCSPWKSPL